MVPAAWVTVDSLPLTPNGKVDLKALSPSPDFGRAAVGDEFVAPRTETERRLSAIWSQVLGVEDIGVNDNFFALGGHSLLAMQVMSRVREDLGVMLLLRAIFDTPTIAALAAAVDERAASASQSAAPALVRVARRGRM